MKSIVITYILLIILASSTRVAAEEYYFKQLFLKEGLPSTIESSFTDNNGSIWISTRTGLIKYDGYTLETYTHDSKPTSLPNNVIYNTIEDKQNNLWVLTKQNLVRYNPTNNGFIRIKDTNGNYIMAYTSCLVEDGILFGSLGKIYKYTYHNKSLSLWKKFGFDPNYNPTSMQLLNNQLLICNNPRKGIKAIDLNNNQMHPIPYHKYVVAIFADSKNQLWIASYNQGVKCYTENGKLLASYTTQNSALSSNTILCIEECDSKIWLGTDGGGINILNPENKEIKILKHIPKDNMSFPVNSIKSLHYDGNMIWASTVRGGLIGIKETFMKTYVGTFLGNETGLSDPTILSLFQDDSGTIWIGTDGGGLNSLEPNTDKFKHHINTWEKKISSITTFDNEHLLYSCFNAGIYLFNKRTNATSPFIIANDSMNKHLFNRQKSVNVYQNTSQSILILSDMLYVYDLKEKCFSQIHSDALNNLFGILLPIQKKSDYTFLNDMKSIYAFNNKTNELCKLFGFKISNDTIINSVTCDEHGVFWIGTNEGFYSFNPGNKQLKKFKANLLNNVMTVISDHRGKIWIGTTDNQLLSWSINDQKLIIYSEADGVMLNEYMNEPRLITMKGDVYLGGVKGLLRIDHRLKINIPTSYHLNLQSVKINGENVPNAAEHSLPWDGVMTLKVCSYENDIFRNRIYRFHIIGTNEQYIESRNPELTIKSLLPGDYIVGVSCSTKDGKWTHEKQLIKLQITPPWYLSGIFIGSCIFIIIVTTVIGLFIALKQKENKIRWTLKEREQQINEEKVQYLINVSHELRTPLTLIYAPLKRILQSLPESNDNYPMLRIIYNQTQRMKNIINMVLDLRKMEVGKNKLIIKPYVLNEWIQHIGNDFHPEALNRNINITYQLDDNIKEVCFDESKCEIIFTNLLINALKHSPDNTSIVVSTLRITETQYVRISIKDHGQGLQATDVKQLFTRYYQGNNEQQGSGIGLSYAKILVELHKGTIGALNNAEEPGATFYFELPLNQIENETICKSRPYLNELFNGEYAQEENSVSSSLDTQHISLLLVDDNSDLTAFLKEGLQAKFKQIRTATDGAEAFEIIKSQCPDIIVSDIMMPQMDGYQLCRAIKEDIEVSHIPIILLTARNDDNSLINGYKNGADGYITKPFELDTLQEQINSILRNKEKIKQYYLKTGFTPRAEDVTFSNIDEKFLLQFDKIIHENLDNPELDVNFLCREIAMSRSSLYKKVKVLTNMGVNDYINKVRMEKAITLISHSDMTITEIAENVGFSTLRYFSTAFKQYTGKAPSTYKEENRNNELS